MQKSAELQQKKWILISRFVSSYKSEFSFWNIYTRKEWQGNKDREKEPDDELEVRRMKSW